MEEQTKEDQFDPDMLGEQIRQHIATVEGVLDQATGDVAKMRDALMKFGFTARTETEADEHYAEMMKKLTQASGQIAVLYGMLAFCKGMVDVAVPLHAMSAAYSAFIDIMVQSVTGKPRVQ